MIVRSSKQSTTHLLLALSQSRQQIRSLHSSLPLPPIPQPTPFVPDAPTFLTLIGRQLSKHAPKITSWESLFSLTSTQLRDLGVEPARSRRYLLWWRDKFRRGEYGVGGDLQNVVDGVAEMRVNEAEVGERVKKSVVNTSLGVEGTPVMGLTVRGARTIVGKRVELVKGSGGSVATLKAAEGLWEVRRGHKVHGGERRRKYVLSLIARKAKAALK